MHSFEPTLYAAHARLAAVHPDNYARTRNSLEGAVTRLSPYLTHGFLSLAEVFAAVKARHPLDNKHKFVFELGWRAYYRHVWEHLGDSIHMSLHTGLLPDDAYSRDFPADVAEARTGLPVIDLAVRTLYQTGYLHNHARMWLASYLVHLRKVHWYNGAQWMLGHLLDGDLASNHLSWQWVAGTGSSKPYLFNAENVAKYAPADWHSSGTVLDTSYEALDHIARSVRSVAMARGASREAIGMDEPVRLTNPPPNSGWSPPDNAMVSGRDVWLQHPWSLGVAPHQLPADALRIGVGFDVSHAASPWSERRWDFVTRGLQTQTKALWWGNVEHVALALQTAKSVHWQSEPHADPALESLRANLCNSMSNPPVSHQQPGLFDPVHGYCRSFSEWWKRTRISHTRGVNGSESAAS